MWLRWEEVQIDLAYRSRGCRVAVCADPPRTRREGLIVRSETLRLPSWPGESLCACELIMDELPAAGWSTHQNELTIYTTVSVSV